MAKNNVEGNQVLDIRVSAGAGDITRVSFEISIACMLNHIVEGMDGYIYMYLLDIFISIYINIHIEIAIIDLYMYVLTPTLYMHSELFTHTCLHRSMYMYWYTVCVSLLVWRIYAHLKKHKYV